MRRRYTPDTVEEIKKHLNIPRCVVAHGASWTPGKVLRKPIQMPTTTPVSASMTTANDGKTMPLAREAM